MIKIFLLFLILIIIIIKINNEYFTTCNFNPFGDTLSNCKDKCNDTIDCNSSICKKICENCDDKRRCKWYDDSCSFDISKEIEPMESYNKCLERCSKKTNCNTVSCIEKCKSCKDNKMHVAITHYS